MKMIRRKLALALAVGVGSIGLFGAAALGAFGQEASTAVELRLAPATSALFGEDRPDKLKQILDGLVSKGTITRAQADAILAAVKDAAGTSRVKTAHVVRDFFETSAQYLGVGAKDLRAKLPGTSLGAIANTTPGKSRDGLVAALNKEGNADIDKALASKRITDEQAAKLRSELPASVTKFVDRTWPAKPTAAVRGPSLKSFLGDMLQSGRDYLGLTLQDLTTQMRSGKSLGDIANATPGKNRAGLIAALTTVANTHIDKALAEQKITPDQAKSFKEKVGAEITSFVDRKHATKNTTSNRTTKTP
ncbi:MAG TPA: hypothetical protein VGR87_07405 [Candidatus Limnocylindria bacterium]|jgi:polyhydroxyalkanoate synthesis regulator phasin|nr:hypothetical protein [Candidatus Limnocylindria bacterium]